MKSIAIIDYAGAKAGMDYYSLSLAEGIASNNTDVCIYSNFKQTGNSTIKILPVYDIKVVKTVPKIIDAVFGTVKACLHAKKEGTGVFVNHLFSAAIFSFIQYLIIWLFRKRIITIVHDISGFGNTDISLFRKLILNRFSYKLVVHNKFSLNELKKLDIVNGIENVKIIKHGGFIEDREITTSHDEIYKQFSLEKDTHYLLFFGQIKEEKGLDLLINAFSKVSGNVKLVIAGRPPRGLSFNKYKEQIEDLGLTERVVTIIRFIEDYEMKLLFKVCKAIVLPYRQIYQSGVLLMAMSNKIPVIASNLEPNAEILIDGSNGVLFENNNEDDLSEKIQLYINNIEKLYPKFKKEAYTEILENYNWSDIGKNYIELIK